MPNSNFTPEESEELQTLLKKIQQNNYWIPDQETWKELQRTVSRWAIELVITDLDNRNAPKILLTRYTETGAIAEHHNLFHIAGGFDKFPENIQETCTRIAGEELSVDVTFQGVLGIHKWTPEEHPWGSRVLSIYAACTPLQPIIQKEGQHFFTLEEVLALGPENMDPKHPHRTFIDQYLKKIESGKIPEPVTLGV